jgi:adenine deaminase
MLVPSEFARLAVVHGTVATVSDPHEIANVCGINGVEYMIENGKSVNFKFYFGAPSCVPATSFETAGDKLTSQDVRRLLNRNEIKYLSEMMNFPGVIHDDPEVLNKIAAAYEVEKPVDGHAPGLRGDPLKKYISAGISTDHECFTEEEALEKLALGMKIIIREGSAARNFDALIDLLNDYPDMIMFCSDDKHPDSLVKGHINDLCKRAFQKRINIFHILKAACINPVLHYGLDTGILKENDPADFIILKDLENFEVMRTFINGICVAENGSSYISQTKNKLINKFHCSKITRESLVCKNPLKFLIGRRLPVIEALDGQLITNKLFTDPVIENGVLTYDLKNDILKIIVINRYHDAPPAIAFIKNFGFKSGAIASSVAHDSHNIIAVGADDSSLLEAINIIIENKGGISCVSSTSNKFLPLPVAGLMSAGDGYEVASAYTEIDGLAKSLGSSLSAPFMTLSFMALLVIPSLKLSDLGLFDGDEFRILKEA